jgi:hypothetical protein
VLSFSTLEKYINVVKNITPIDDSFLLKYRAFLCEHDLSIPTKLKTAYHHIVPKSEAKRIGMPDYQYNSAQNMVYLSHKDHAIAHILLARAIPTRKNCFIVMQMLSFSKSSSFSDLINNYEYFVEKYAEIREEANKYISEIQKGRHVSEETRSKNRIGRLGKKDSEASRRKKREAHLGKIMPESTKAKHRRENLPIETRRKLSEGHKPMAEEEKDIRRQRMRETMIGKQKSPDHKIKIANAILGSHFYNNGKVEIQIHGNPPDGFILGRLPEYKNKMRGDRNPNAGNFIWSNGVVEIQSKVCPGNGFTKGKLRDYTPPVDLFE